MISDVIMIDECLNSERVAERTLKRGEYLYREGDARILFYRIDSGAIAVFGPADRCPGSNVEIASTGDFVGLGYLDSYCETARAVIDSVITCIDPANFVEFIDNDPILKKRQADAVEREFEHRKSILTENDRSSPVERIAAFLVAISHRNASEGRDPTIIADMSESAEIADLLGLHIGELHAALAKLQNLGLIEWREGNPLRLRETYDLEHIASARK